MAEKVKFEYIGVEDDDIYEIVEEDPVYVLCEDSQQETLSQQNEQQFEGEGEFLLIINLF